MTNTTLQTQRGGTGALAGTVVSASTIDDVVREAGLDFEVEQAEIAPAIRSNAYGVDLSDFRANYYRPTGGVEAITLGIVNKSYGVIQNADMLRPLDYIRDEFGASYEAAGLLDKGRKPFVEMRVPTLDGEAGGDTILGRLIAKTAHDGSGALRIWAAPALWVCSNGLVGAWGGAKPATVTLRHTKHVEVDTHLAATLLSKARENMDGLIEWADRMAGVGMSWVEFDNLVRGIYGDERDLEASARTVSNRERVLGTVEMVAQTTRGIARNADMSAWDAFNALTEYNEWHRPVRGADDPMVARARRSLEGGVDRQTAVIKTAVDRFAAIAA